MPHESIREYKNTSQKEVPYFVYCYAFYLNQIGLGTEEVHFSDNNKVFAISATDLVLDVHQKLINVRVF